MEISKPVAWLIIALVAVVVLWGGWFLFLRGGQGASSSIPQSAYPEVKNEMRLPDSELQQGPPPLPGMGK